MKNAKVFLYVLGCALIAYYVWSFFTSSRYQALCNVSFWSATRQQLEGCVDIKRELDEQK